MHRSAISKTLRRASLVATVGTLVVASNAQAQILPAGAAPVAGSVAVGAATANRAGGLDLAVSQTSNRAVIQWISFSLGALDRITFNQPNTQAATLNRVSGAQQSIIAGQLNANGSVYLVNPNGIAITNGGVVQTGGGFVASTLNISNSDFMNGANSFTGSGASASVSNAGRVTANGFVALLGGSASNSGTISVPAGRVALASGEAITLDINGANFLQVAMPTSGTTAAVTNSGTITGGRIELSIASAANAVRNVINMTGTLNADSATGSGGIIVLSASGAGTVSASGTLSARATGPSGSGGLITLRGASLSTFGLSADTTAANGATGLLIQHAGADYTPVGDLGALLAKTNVNIITDMGTITVGNDVAWTSPTTLTLQAGGNIALNAGINASSTAGALVLSAGIGNAGTITATGAINVGLFNLTRGNWIQNTGTLPAFYARDFRFSPASATFLRVTGGSGTGPDPYKIADIYGLQGVASSNQLGSDVTLANAIDASGTALWNGGAGFVPIGTDGNGLVWNGSSFVAIGTIAAGSRPGYSGIFTGVGRQITGLTINRGTSKNVGLFGVSSGTILRVIVANGSVTGFNGVGGLVGLQFGGGISGSTARISVTGNNLVGGLVGNQVAGAVVNSAATGSVRGVADVGGLVGYTSGGSITGSSANGAVTGQSYVGGLIGYAYNASVQGSFARGAVTGNIFAGSLIGILDGGSASGTGFGQVNGTDGSLQPIGQVRNGGQFSGQSGSN